MKYITFTIPCYNSQDYMRRCIDNLVAVGEDIEIIIVDDGSKDDTGKIADEYQNSYPNIVRVIHKENGGHGSGVMAGIHNAKGIYFKVVDSDDWVETEDVLSMIKIIKKNIENNKQVDLYITNYVYEHMNDDTRYVMHYRKFLKKDAIITWADMKRINLETVFLMHSLMFSLDVLKESKMELPNHTFYVDDAYAYIPLPYVKSLYYHDLDLYHYYIGREGQSINYETMCNRYEQQQRVFELMFRSYSLDTLKTFVRPFYKYMFQFLMIIAAITIMTTIGTNKDKEKRKVVFKEFNLKLKSIDKKLYNRIRYRSACSFAFLVPFYRLRSFFIRKLYRFYQKRIKIG
ncbi:MAG: glycosyltransferase family 2 protein [Bacilli bacterium]|nr:glycosyltransferase family 2 protein [Bacilli bacterium]